MRDPARRQRILKLIETIWMAPDHHDLRLYQLLDNVTGARGDPYFYEDAKLGVALRCELDRLRLIRPIM